MKKNSRGYPEELVKGRWTLSSTRDAIRAQAAGANLRRAMHAVIVDPNVL
jgi:hypothetical protein